MNIHLNFKSEANPNLIKNISNFIDLKKSEPEKLILFFNSCYSLLNFLVPESIHQISTLCQKIQLTLPDSFIANVAGALKLRIERHAQPILFNSRENSSISVEIGLKRIREESEVKSSKKAKFFNELNIEEILLLNDVLNLDYSDLKKINKELYEKIENCLKTHNSNWREIQDSNGYTILHYVSIFNKSKIIKGILYSAKNINDQSNRLKITPLHCAMNNSVAFKLLIERNANPGLKDARNRNIFEWAIINKNNEFLKILIDWLIKVGFENEYKILIEEIIYLTAQLEDPGLFDFIINRGIGIDSSSPRKTTALMLACASRNEKIVQRLIAAGADVNKKNLRNGSLPINYAIESGALNIVLELVKHHADVNFILADGQNFVEQVLSSRKLSSSESEFLLNSVTSLDKTINEKIVSPKLLASIWGITHPLFFNIRDLKIEFMGLFPYSTLNRMSQFLQAYLPELTKHFPTYFDKEKTDKILRLSSELCLSYKFKNISSKEILASAKHCPQILTSSCNEHMTSVVFDENKFVKCDRGGIYRGHGVTTYQLQKKITEEVIDKIRNPDNFNFFYNEVNQILGLKKLTSYALKDQKVGNCTWANLKAALFAVFTLLDLDQSKKSPVKEIYKSFTSFTRKKELELYLEKVKLGILEPDWLLLSQIKLTLNRKLRGKLTGLQKENFEGALKLFEVYLKPKICTITPQNKSEIIHYFIAMNDQQAIENFLSLYPDFDFNQHSRGIVPLLIAKKEEDHTV